MRRLGAIAALVVGAGIVVPAAGADEPPPCTAPDAPGTAWASYGHDLANSRHQAAVPDLDPVAVATGLEPLFVQAFVGDVNNTPVVTGGCVFVAAPAGGQAGEVRAIDAATGAAVWSVPLAVGTPAYGGPIVGSPAVHGSLVLVPVNRAASPFVVALDRSTGAEAWRTTLDTQHSSGTNASLVVHDGIAFAGFFGAAGPGEPERGGFVLLEASTGDVLAKTFVIPDDDFAAGYGGAGIWATPAIDTETGFAYVGTSNPHSPQKIHERSTSILEIDLRRGPTLGEIVGHYQGFRDTMVPGAEQQPVCETKPDVYYVGRFSLTCAAVDVDFGSSPNLIRTDDGRTLVGNLQKAGVYHLVDTADMTAVSQTPAGPPCFACNAGSTAYADGMAFVPAGPPGELVAVDVATGHPRWVGHLTGATAYNAVTVAGGLVWTVDAGGHLNAFDAATGAQVLKRPLLVDTGASMARGSSSSGIAAAGDVLYIAAANHLIAYRLPA